MGPNREKLVEDVIPHEAGHTVLAEKLLPYFRDTVPRWCDEGICSNEESEETQAKIRSYAKARVASRTDIPMDRLMNARDYPQDVWGFYGQSLSTVEFLTESPGIVSKAGNTPQERQRYLTRFLKYSGQYGFAPRLKQFYGYESTNQLQRDWRGWVEQGSEKLQ